MEATDRILEKIERAHLTGLGPPADEGVVAAFERTHGLRLPPAYRAFLLRVGNGGTPRVPGRPPSRGNLPPWPTLGPGDRLVDVLFPLGQVETGCLPHPRLIEPGLTFEDWTALRARHGAAGDSIEVETWERLHGGVLIVGTQGCQFDFGLLVGGEHDGRVVLVERCGVTRPEFPLERDFLAWYERRLDEGLARLPHPQ